MGLVAQPSQVWNPWTKVGSNPVRCGSGSPWLDEVGLLPEAEDGAAIGVPVDAAWTDPARWMFWMTSRTKRSASSVPGSAVLVVVVVPPALLPRLLLLWACWWNDETTDPSTDATPLRITSTCCRGSGGGMLLVLLLVGVLLPPVEVASRRVGPVCSSPGTTEGTFSGLGSISHSSSLGLDSSFWASSVSSSSFSSTSISSSSISLIVLPPPKLEVGTTVALARRTGGTRSTNCRNASASSASVEMVMASPSSSRYVMVTFSSSSSFPPPPPSAVAEREYSRARATRRSYEADPPPAVGHQRREKLIRRTPPLSPICSLRTACVLSDRALGLPVPPLVPVPAASAMAVRVGLGCVLRAEVVS
mmetsp:Transcript_8337/g.23305  ORF Transcript_8337/g.23305 Transcript_8337/m.23305 type:complete len:362 (-) Transcript_8337:9-1094(-)